MPRLAILRSSMDAATKVELYRKMLLIRRFEEAAGQAYTQEKIWGFCHLYTGEEAVAVGAISSLRPDDYVIASYREHGHALARGADPSAIMAELFGKATGVSKGKGGSMHLFDAKVRFMGGTGIVGGQIPIGTGAAFAIKYSGGDQVCLTFFGEGAVPQGVFHESLNLASLWSLPVVYICENNHYAMGTAVDKTSATFRIDQKGLAYDIEGSQVDGMDVTAVYEAVSRAVGRARKDKRPSLLEILTYRFRGHSMADAQSYRTKQEVEEYKQRDPVLSFKDRLVKEGTLTDATAQKIDEEVRAIVKKAVADADAAPFPTEESLYEDVHG